MWIEFFSNNFFLKSLYRHEPNLNSLRVSSFSLSDDGFDAVMIFDLGASDFVPEKWSKLNYNAASVELTFYNLKKVNLIRINNDETSSDIVFSKDLQINMTVRGRFEIDLEAEIATISKVRGYQNEASISSGS